MQPVQMIAGESLWYVLEMIVFMSTTTSKYLYTCQILHIYETFFHGILLFFFTFFWKTFGKHRRPGNRCRHFYILRQGLAQYEVRVIY